MGGDSVVMRAFAELDEWVDEANREARADGGMTLSRSEFRVVGQTAIIEGGLKFSARATYDLDTFTDAKAVVQQKLKEILSRYGLELESLPDQIWMPEETTYREIFSGDYVTVLVADAAYVFASKARFAPEKNREDILNFFAHQTKEELELFAQICAKYQVDISAF